MKICARSACTPETRMATTSECRSRNQPKILGRKPISYMQCQPRDNPGYVRNERKYLRSDETKTLDFSAICGAITGFGTQGGSGSGILVRSQPEPNVGTEIRSLLDRVRRHRKSSRCLRTRSINPHSRASSGVMK
jgi:hypothetical protein